MGQMVMFRTMVGNIFQDTPVHPKSHVRGWAAHWAEMIGDGCVVHKKQDSMEGLDVLYYDHGVNATPGQMNFFSGITDVCVDRVEQVLDTPNLMIVSLDFPMPVEQYGEGLMRRVGLNSTSPRFTTKMAKAIIKRLERDRHKVLRQEDYIEKVGGFIIGDSHATAYAAKGEPVIRHNGLTLSGLIKRDVVGELLDQHGDVNRVTIMAGSIDIRHHIGLKKDPLGAVESLAHDLVDYADGIGTDFDTHISLCVPVPVEDEGRKIPKTGWLNDRPFTGSQSDRALWTGVFEAVINDYWGDTVAPPADWYQMPPADYAAKIMELASSVHIAPPFYRRHGGWRD